MRLDIAMRELEALRQRVAALRAQIAVTLGVVFTFFQIIWAGLVQFGTTGKQLRVATIFAIVLYIGFHAFAFMVLIVQLGKARHPEDKESRAWQAMIATQPIADLLGAHLRRVTERLAEGSKAYREQKAWFHIASWCILAGILVLPCYALLGDYVKLP